MTTADNQLAQRLAADQILLGILHGYPAEGILETIGFGWDFVWIDGQHGQFSIDSALRSVRVASAIGLETVLRTPTQEAGLLGQYADTAASALMVPQVDSIEAAMAIVRALRFPPCGNRSFGGRRSIDQHGRDYYRRHEPLVIAQIESQSGLKIVDQIAAIEGVDLLFFGADDMKLSLGLPVETPIHESDKLLDAQQAVAYAARNAGKWCGCGIVEPRDIPRLRELGYQLLAIGGDITFLRTGARQTLEEGRAKLKQTSQVSNSNPN